MPTYTDEEIARALRDAKGLTWRASQALGCAPITVIKRIARSALVRAEARDARGSLDDLAEFKLFEKIEAGDLNAITFYLRTRARHRGYGEKMEVEVNASMRSTFEFVISLIQENVKDKEAIGRIVRGIDALLTNGEFPQNAIDIEGGPA